jgi:hypothetical protein
MRIEIHNNNLIVRNDIWIYKGKPLNGIVFSEVSVYRIVVEGKEHNPFGRAILHKKGSHVYVLDNHEILYKSTD